MCNKENNHLTNAIIKAKDFGHQMAQKGIRRPAFIRNALLKEPGWSGPGFNHGDRQIIKQAAVDAAQRNT